MMNSLCGSSENYRLTITFDGLMRIAKESRAFDCEIPALYAPPNIFFTYPGIS